MSNKKFLHITVLFYFSLALSLRLVFGAVNALVAPVTTVVNYCETNKVKVLFYASGVGLCYIDYSEVQSGSPVIHEIPGTLTARFPVISPDGQWVSYATGVTFEFDQKISTSWLRPLSITGSEFKVADTAYVPRFVKNATNPTLVYSTCSLNPNKKLAFDGCGRTVKAEWNGTTWRDSVIWPSGSYLGGLSYDDRYLADGEETDHCYMLDLHNASAGPHVLHNIPCKTASGNDSLCTSQVCNTSVSSSRIFTNSMLYLDFGFLSTQEVTSSFGSWGLHQRIFVSNFDGNIIRFYDMPIDIPIVDATEQCQGSVTSIQWNFPEWSNHPYYAAATVLAERLWYLSQNPLPWNYRSLNEKIYLYNLKDSTYLKLVESKDTSLSGTLDLKWPYVWIDVPVQFQENNLWLKPSVKTKWNPFKKLPGILESHSIFESNLIKTAYVFSVNGALLKKIYLSRSTRVCLENFLPPGIVIVRLELIDGAVQTMKIMGNIVR